jgi:HEAT repeat protein
LAALAGFLLEITMDHLEHWLKLYESNNPTIKVRAARSMLRNGPEIPLPVLLSIFDTLSNEGLGAAAEKVLKQRSDPELVPEMIARLKSPDDFIREVACTVLGEAGDRNATSHLMGMLNDTHMMVRRAAAFALAALKDPASTPELKRQRVLRRSDDINVRFAIECALKELGEEYVSVLSDAS